jgi:release factor glutamine methyltransferase
MQWRTNKLLDLKNQYVHELLAYYEKREAESLVGILVQHFFGLSRASLLSKPDFRLSESEMLQLHFAVKDLKKYRPVQYIVGETEFFGIKIKVNDTVLIPRPETEELVQLIVETEKEQNVDVLDIGTGSGCIAIALQKFLMASRVSAIDISPAALQLASENCAFNQTNIHFQEINILDKNQWKHLGQFDLIVSNPPYVTEAEKNKMQANVLNYEPHQALFVPDENALVFYEAIFSFAREHLNKNGKIYVEINELKGEETVKLLKTKHFLKVSLHKDIHGKNRFVSGIKK